LTTPEYERTIRIGTSGFLYDHWRGRFYTPSARGSELELYAEQFETVELNVTFYRMPAAATFRSWAARVPDGFPFAVKASRYLTHVLRLREPREPVAFLMERASELGPHLGPILLQLPPDMPADLPRLEATLDAFPATAQVAVEPRHPSWFNEELRSLLTTRNAALCLADRRGPLTPQWRTADWTYLRFHGGRARPRPCYSDRALDSWAERVRDDGGADTNGFAYFNNDHQGCALRDSAVFGRRLVERGVAVGRVPDIGDEVLIRPGLAEASGRAATRYPRRHSHASARCQ
jgi:uncharacterized protein YecE (DUF72 family)